MMIDITGVDLEEFAKEVYDLSVPVGFGRLNYTPGQLSDEEAEQLVDIFATDERIALNMDYVNGRCCKMMVYRKGDKLEIQDVWFDHSTDQLDELLRRCDISRGDNANP